MDDDAAPPAESAPPGVGLLTFDITLARTSGRHIVIVAPADTTPTELLDAINVITGKITDELAARALTRSPLVIARGPIT